MFAFGGWVPIQPQEKEEHPDKEWKCSNTLAVLNLNSLTWEQPAEPTSDPNGNEPGARAGHSGVVINKRIYIWSGRDGYKKTWSSQGK
jgi:host cell factor